MCVSVCVCVRSIPSCVINTQPKDVVYLTIVLIIRLVIMELEGRNTEATEVCWIVMERNGTMKLFT